MTQQDGDGLPTQGEEAEALLQKETGFRCTCGEPDTAGVLHRQDGPCVVIPTERTRLDTMMDEQSMKAKETERPNWLERLEAEHHDLDIKGMALHTFIRTNPLFLKLPDRDQFLLNNQMEAMGAYYSILTERLFRAKNPALAKQADEAALKEAQEANVASVDQGSTLQ